MNVLLVGGAGHVGTTLRPALEREHQCRYFDRRAIPEAGERSLVGDVNDDEAIKAAVAGTDAVIYLAMGVGNSNGDRPSVGDINAAFDVNVRGAYRFLHHALSGGVKTFVYASSLSVYSGLARTVPVDEARPADEWSTYGLSKRLGERLCEAAGQRFPEATILALRLIMPRSEEQWPEHLRRIEAKRQEGEVPPYLQCHTGPNDLRRLFLAALACDRPGAHVVQATGDVQNAYYPNHHVTELLGWTPRGE